MDSTTNVSESMAQVMCGGTAAKYLTTSPLALSSMAECFVFMGVSAQPWQLWTRQVATFLSFT